jgi:hypothetical protein
MTKENKKKKQEKEKEIKQNRDPRIKNKEERISTAEQIIEFPSFDPTINSTQSSVIEDGINKGDNDQAQFSPSGSVEDSTGLDTPEYVSEGETENERFHRLKRRRGIDDEATELNREEGEVVDNIHKKLKSAHDDKLTNSHLPCSSNTVEQADDFYSHHSREKLMEIIRSMSNTSSSENRSASSDHTPSMLLSDGDLPSKIFSGDLTSDKVKRYAIAVNSLLNSGLNYKENRKTFPINITSLVDLWWDSSVEGANKPQQWMLLDITQFEQFLLGKLSKDTTPDSKPDEAVRALIEKGVVLSMTNTQKFYQQIALIRTTHSKIVSKTTATEKYLKDKLKKKMIVKVEGEHYAVAHEALWGQDTIQNTTDFQTLLVELCKAVGLVENAISSSNKFLVRKDDKKKKLTANDTTGNNNKITGAVSTTKLCWTCGNPHGDKLCLLKSASHSNHENKPWADSTQGKFFKSKGFNNCPRTADAKANSASYKGGHKGENLLSLSDNNRKHVINMTLLLPQGKEENLQVLLDTGATTRDYISNRVASIIEASGKVRLASSAIICSGFENMCEKCLGQVDIEVISKDESDQSVKLNLLATIIQTPFDLIIGRPSIKKYRLAKRFPSQFFDSEDKEEEMLSVVEDNHEKTLLINARKEAARASSIQDKIHRLASFNEASNNKYKTNAAHRSAFEREDIEEIPLDKLEAIPSSLIENRDEDVQLPTRIFGPESLQTRLRQTLELYSDCFSTSLKSEPARVPPYELRINESEWEIQKNRLQPRRMDKTRQEEMFRQINVLQAANVLKVSEAPYYCHPLMVPKPMDKWRFCVDFKPVNKVSTTEKWPLPNIQEMLRRIGEQRPKFFIILDLTSGYHQIPMAKTSRRFTAFITYWGVFEWLRMPMGLEGAASNFQKILVTIVLAGLVMIKVELYLDDLIIYARSEDELIEKFIIILERFRKFNITINPEKSELGVTEATFVGHTLNESGLHFKREKLDSVLNFPVPIFSKQLKSFVCLASYFRDHVRNHAARVQPLFDLLKGYERNNRIVWTKEGEAAFEDIRKAIHECPRIFFLDNVSPIYLYTDASNYGIGAYLYQLIDGKEIPIAFISRSIDERMRKWATPVKEGYAIFYALGKFEYLLRDKHFIIKTDHKNLTLLKEKYGTEDKVQRWFQCYQGFDFKVEDSLEYVKGEDNPVADAFSRLCPIEADEEETLCLLEDDELYVPRKEWKIISMIHNSLVGHHGVERSMQKLMSLGHKWKDMRSHVRRFKKMCACCQKMENIGPPIKAHKFTVSSNSPMSVLAIDFIEGLIPDEYGNNTIMVVIDTFSRFVELFPMKGNSAQVAAHALIQHIGRYGMPYQITSDKGSAYISKLIKEIIDMMGTNLVHTMAYSKQENAIVERANKEIERHIRNFIFDNEVIQKWSKYIPLVQRICNSCKHRITGVTPAEILFGNAVDLDRGIFLAYVPDDTPQKLSHWMADMRKVQAKIINIARGNLTRHAEIHMQTEPINLTEFPINSYVLVEHRHNSLRKGPKSKLLPYRKGPVRVVNAIGSKYTVQDLVTKRNKDYHVKRLVQFNYDPEIHDPLTYALRDETELFAIDKISHIRGNPEGPKANIHFKVHWKNESKTTMEPWKVVRNTAALQTFLTNHKKELVRQLLPNNVEIEQDSDTDSDSEMDTGFEST